MIRLNAKLVNSPAIYGVVRDKNGRPRIDGDPKELHPAIIAMFTEAEQKELGVENTPIAVAANGHFRLRKVNATSYRCENRLIAFGSFWEDGKEYRLAERVDVERETSFTINIQKE